MKVPNIQIYFTLAALVMGIFYAGSVKAEVPVITEFINSANGEVLDQRADRLPAYYGKADAAPSALTPTGTAWKARWQTQLIVPAKDDYHFELRGAGAGALQIDDKDVVGQLNETSAAITLAAGDHPLVITFTPPKSGDAQLRLFWKSSSFGWEPVAATSLKQPASLPGDQHALLRSQRQLIVDNNCNACHQSEHHIALPEASEMGPSLAGIGSRLDETWMARWIENPQGHRPGSRMPALFHGADAKQKSADIAAYLATMKSKTSSAGNKGNKSAGAKLYKALNCYACHDMNAADSIERIPLANISKKYQHHALAAFLENPGEHHAATRMPDFKLSKQEAADLAAFLYSLEKKVEQQEYPKGDPAKGKTLLVQSGCMNCHDAPGHENQAKFSNLAAMLKATSQSPQSGCLAPKGEGKKAPHFSADLTALQKVDAAQVSSALLQDHPAEYAQRQFEALNCMACHSRDGLDASRLMRVEEVAHIDISDPKAHATGPEKLPMLDHFGHKLRADWMAELFAGSLPSKEWNKTLTFLSMAHAKLSPSAAKIWMACPGMPSLLSSMNVEYKVGIPAATGTLVHEMVETLLKGRLNNLTLEEYYLDSTHHIDDFDITVDQEMIDCAHVYVDYIKRRSEELNVKRPLIEERVNMVEIHDQLWGTADAILIGENIIEVVDLKAGKWAVEPDSPQLKIYALGALSRYGNAECTVQMTIVQPRGWHKDGIIRSYSTSAANLVDWAYETLKPAAEACFEEIPTYNYSKDGCRWCNAKDACETYKLNQKGE